jgi:hypothetical protein
MTKDRFEKIVATSDSFVELEHALRAELFPREDVLKVSKEPLGFVEPDGSENEIEVRAEGEYEDYGIFLPQAPTGYEYAVVRDDDDCTVLICRRIK